MRTALRWWSELRCDAAAVAYAGAESMYAWADGVRQRRIGAKRRRMRSLLSHPPPALRLAFHPRRQGALSTSAH